MTSFESKWGNITEEVSTKKKLYIILVTQFLISIFILISLQPPFVTVSRNDDYSHPSVSITLILLVSIICVITAFFMNENINNIININKK